MMSDKTLQPIKEMLNEWLKDVKADTEPKMYAEVRTGILHTQQVRIEERTKNKTVTT